DRYAQLGYALDSLGRSAPNAAVYLDGTHSNWLPAGEAAYRLRRAGVERAAGFFLNEANDQPTSRLIQFGTWVSKCLRYAGLPDDAGGTDATRRYRQCASVPDGTGADDDRAWAQVDAWYAEHVDRAAGAPGGAGALVHFVINTNRNGRPLLDTSMYARPPYNQPPAVVRALRDGSWCMPPGRGLGQRPTADTVHALVDAYLWIDPPGIALASCDIAGGARAWDYSR